MHFLGGKYLQNTFLGPSIKHDKPCLLSAMFVVDDRLKEYNQVNSLKIKELSKLIV